MDFINFVCWFVLLINANTVTSANDTDTINTIDILQKQLHQILIQFCATEIDRNKTTSAILKFNQLSNAEESIKDLVQFYTENYDDTFDNLLHFVNQLSSKVLEDRAVTTLTKAIESNKLNVIDVLSFENFIKNKLELETVDDEVEYYTDLLAVISDHIKKVITTADFKELAKFVVNSSYAERAFELLPTIAQGIDLNNFTDIERIFSFSMELPNVHKFKLIRKLLGEMNKKSQYRHVFHVILQLRIMKSLASQGKQDVNWCSLKEVELELPKKLRPLVNQGSVWNLKNVAYDRFLYTTESEKYKGKQLMLIETLPYNHWWLFESSDYNSIQIQNTIDNYYMYVEYCFHNDTFPLMNYRRVPEGSQFQWYPLVSDDLTYIQIKTVYSKELLIVDDAWENGVFMHRVGFTSVCADCDSSKWLLLLQREVPEQMYIQC